MVTVLAWLRDNAGGAAGYLHDAGLSVEQCSACASGWSRPDRSTRPPRDRARAAETACARPLQLVAERLERDRRRLHARAPARAASRPEPGCGEGAARADTCRSPRRPDSLRTPSCRRCRGPRRRARAGRARIEQRPTGVVLESGHRGRARRRRARPRAARRRSAAARPPPSRAGTGRHPGCRLPSRPR